MSALFHVARIATSVLLSVAAGFATALVLDGMLPRSPSLKAPVILGALIVGISCGVMLYRAMSPPTDPPNGPGAKKNPADQGGVGGSRP